MPPLSPVAPFDAGSYEPAPPPGSRGIASGEDLWARPLACVPELLRTFGVSFETVAERAVLAPSVLEDLESRISFADVGRLIIECEAATGCPHFGLLVGQRSGLWAIGVTGGLAEHSASVRKALDVLTKYLHIYDRGAALTLHQRSHREAELVYSIYHPDTPGSRHIAEGALASVLGGLRALCGSRFSPIEVTFACDRPSDTIAYRRCFGSAIRFNAARFAIVFNSSWLERPISGADPRERTRLARLVTELDRSRRASLNERSREALAHLLIAMPPTVGRVAHVLGISRRTLNRRLAREGTSFKALLEDTRSDMARYLLRETRLPAIEIAATLHYTTPSAFSRAFKRWARGTTPRRARGTRAAEPDGLDVA